VECWEKREDELGAYCSDEVRYPGFGEYESSKIDLFAREGSSHKNK
jgi:hypothetical protein